MISGHVPEVRDQENCNSIVRNLLKDVHINIPETEISTAHRLGKRPINGKPDKRNIVFKLCRRDIKRDILDACRQQKPRYFVNESLTPTRSTIMYVLRKVKREHPDIIGNARSYDGNITVWLPSSSSVSSSQPKFNKLLVNTRNKLEELLQDKLACNSDKFVERWPDANM